MTVDSAVIDYRCSGCAKRLCAPAEWAGRSAACPVCSVSMVIPAVSDVRVEPVRVEHVAERVAAVDGIVFDSRFMTVPSAPPAPANSNAKVGYLRRWRSTFIIAGAVAFVAVAVGGGTWVFRNYVKADGIMKHRGFGRQLSKDEVPVSQASQLTFRISKAEKAVEESPDSLQATLELMAVYDDAARSIDQFGHRHAAYILNNAAWLYATTVHKGARDPAKALEMATRAVEITHRRAAGILDTLAEALLANGRASEALEVEKEAVARDPSNPELQKRLQFFQSMDFAGQR